MALGRVRYGTLRSIIRGATSMLLLVLGAELSFPMLLLPSLLPGCALSEAVVFVLVLLRATTTTVTAAINVDVEKFSVVITIVGHAVQSYVAVVRLERILLTAAVSGLTLLIMPYASLLSPRGCLHGLHPPRQHVIRYMLEVVLHLTNVRRDSVVTEQFEIIRVVLEMILQSFRIEHLGPQFRRARLFDGDLGHRPADVLHPIAESFNLVQIKVEGEGLSLFGGNGAGGVSITVRRRTCHVRLQDVIVRGGRRSDRGKAGLRSLNIIQQIALFGRFRFDE
mmetsp:Transcript_4536/g.12666  ORF Transcript_4536/g.12666 Transcript_4536/m.12666 type:complete len:280 (-) Transcript_4536:961-1800(-)